MLRSGLILREGTFLSKLVGGQGGGKTAAGLASFIPSRDLEVIPTDGIALIPAPTFPRQHFSIRSQHGRDHNLVFKERGKYARSSAPCNAVMKRHRERLQILSLSFDDDAIRHHALHLTTFAASPPKSRMLLLLLLRHRALLLLLLLLLPDKELTNNDERRTYKSTATI